MSEMFLEHRTLHSQTWHIIAHGTHVLNGCRSKLQEHEQANVAAHGMEDANSNGPAKGAITARQKFAKNENCSL